MASLWSDIFCELCYIFLIFQEIDWYGSKNYCYKIPLITLEFRLQQFATNTVCIITVTLQYLPVDPFF